MSLGYNEMKKKNNKKNKKSASTGYVKSESLAAVIRGEMSL